MLPESKGHFMFRSLILTKEGDVWYFMCGPATLFLSVFKQNYTEAFHCLILSEWHSWLLSFALFHFWNETEYRGKADIHFNTCLNEETEHLLTLPMFDIMPSFNSLYLTVHILYKVGLEARSATTSNYKSFQSYMLLSCWHHWNSWMNSCPSK